MSRVVVIGDVARDYIIRVGVGYDEKVPVLQSWRLLGGTGANVAAQARRLGSEVQLISAVGDDPIGADLLAELDGLGIDARYIQRLHGASTFATIVLGGRGRTVYVEPGVGSRISTAPTSVLEAADRIFLSYAPELLRGLIMEGHGRRLVVSVEPWMLATAGFADSLREVGVIVTNAAGWEALQASPAQCAGSVVVTAGGSPVRYFENGALQMELRPPAIDAVDATGAGDAFAGAFVHELAAGVPLQDAVKTATFAGALCATRLGAINGQGSVAEIVAMRQ